MAAWAPTPITTRRRFKRPRSISRGAQARTTITPKSALTKAITTMERQIDRAGTAKNSAVRTAKETAKPTIIRATTSARLST